MSTRVNRPCSSRAASTLIGAASRDGRERDEQRLAGDHAAHLPRRAADRAEEGELAVALLDRERERAATTKIATKAASSAKTVSPATVSSRLRASSGDSASPRFAPVSTRRRGWSSAA